MRSLLLYFILSISLVGCNAARLSPSQLISGVSSSSTGTGVPLSPGTPSSPSTPSANPSQGYNIGMNVPGINYFNSAPMYADVTMQFGANAGPWNIKDDWGGTPSTDATGLDSTGAPTVAAWSAFTGDYPSGAYTVTWDGTGTITFGVGTLTGMTSTTTNGVKHNTGTWNFTQTSPPAVDVFVYTSAPTTNIHMMVPAAEQVSGSIFTKTFLTKIAPFSTLRFMDALNTNGNVVRNWSDRTWPNAGSRSRAQGIAYEDIIQLANQTGKDVWINIPAEATDDYVCRLARLLFYGEPGDSSNAACNPSAPANTPAGAVTINSKSKIYLEHSNEIWNWSFAAPFQMYCMANGAPDHPDKTCDITQSTSAIAKATITNHTFPWSSTDLYANGVAMGFILSKRNGDMFKGIFGTRKLQIKVVYNVQSAWPTEAVAGMTLYVSGYGAPASSIDYFAVAPYFNVDSDTYTDTLDDLFANLKNNTLLDQASSDTNAMYSWVQADVVFANTYNVPLVAYEGGSGLSDGTNLSVKTAAQSDPRMYSMVQQSFQIWNTLVGKQSLFNYYSLVGGSGANGSWGAVVNLTDPGAQKYDALLSLTLKPGDTNGDGVVDDTDCAALKASFGKTGTFWWSQGDFNHDGVVDAKDLALLNSNKSGTPCAAP